jgi:hypothetical protein
VQERKEGRKEGRLLPKSEEDAQLGNKNPKEVRVRERNKGCLSDGVFASFAVA